MTAAAARGLGRALAGVTALPSHQLREIEADWRSEAMTAEYLPEVDDMTARGTDLLDRADVVDAFLFHRP